jgi:CrcB protein
VLRSILAICLGASAGALSRWGIGLAMASLHPHIPIGTLAVNLLGGFGVGVAAAGFELRPVASPEWRLLLVTGFLGAFTTFSSFSLEVVGLFRGGRSGWALLTMSLHLAGSLLCTAAGIALILALRGR